MLLFVHPLAPPVAFALHWNQRLNEAGGAVESRDTGHFMNTVTYKWTHIHTETNPHPHTDACTHTGRSKTWDKRLPQQTPQSTAGRPQTIVPCLCKRFGYVWGYSELASPGREGTIGFYRVREGYAREAPSNRTNFK